MRLGQPLESQRGGIARLSLPVYVSFTPKIIRLPVHFCPYVRLLSGGKALPVNGFDATPTATPAAEELFYVLGSPLFWVSPSIS